MSFWATRRISRKDLDQWFTSSLCEILRRAERKHSSFHSGQTHQKYLWIFIFYSQKFNLLASHRSHKSHRGASLRPRLSASPSVFSRMAHASLRCVLREICEICVKLNHLCELFLVRLPCSMVALHATFARINYSLREDKSFFSRG